MALSTIGTVTKTEKFGNLTVKNVPYKKHDYPCDEGCCENMLSIGIGTHLKVSWLFTKYMPEQNIETFDFNNFTEQMTELWKETR